ncbi:hypothetical protein RCL1_004126 [Eukaryota sp. TZLM3-RCL]
MSRIYIVEVPLGDKVTKKHVEIKAGDNCESVLSLLERQGVDTDGCTIALNGKSLALDDVLSENGLAADAKLVLVDDLDLDLDNFHMVVFNGELYAVLPQGDEEIAVMKVIGDSDSTTLEPVEDPDICEQVLAQFSEDLEFSENNL